jgi:DHA1 family inner membrane transport protein
VRLLPLYGLVLCTSAAQATLVTLLPALSRQLRLSSLEAASLLSVSLFCTLLVSVPVGVLATRVPIRALVVGAAALLAASLAVQAMAIGFPFFLVGRALFGIAFGMVWTIGLALLSETTTRTTSALGAAVAVSGVGHLLGPPYAGYTAEHLSLHAPFAGLAVLALAVTALMIRVLPRRAEQRYSRQPLVRAVRAVQENRQVRGALLLIATLGLVAGVVQVAIPAQLDRNGLSAAEIGLALGAGAAVWTAVSGQAAAWGDHALKRGAISVLLTALAAAAMMAAATSATAAMIAFLILHAAFASPLSTITYPLARAGARAAGAPVGAVIGMTNTLWAAAAMAGPLLAATLADALGRRFPFALIVVLCASLAIWTVWRRNGRLVRAHEAEDQTGEATPYPCRSMPG